ncbi:MAG: hypothetical protein GDA37_09335 [Ekhidna sp.]|nr:hypothetical protein [Ekhidna sp.]
MIAKIIRFELWGRFKQPMTLLFFLMLVFQGIWYTQGSYEYYVNDATLMNGAALFYKNFAGGGMLLVIIIALITGTVLYKDIQYQTAGFIYATPIKEKQFFLGRLLSAYFINVIIGFGILIGMALTPYSGIGSPDKFGPMPWGQMFHGFFTLTVPNLLILTMVCFSVIVYFRRMAAGYLSIFLLVMLFLVSESTKDNAANLTTYLLIDPFAYVYTSFQMDALPADQKNTGFLIFNSIFYLNRLIWVGGSLFFFFMAYRKFSFKLFINASRKSKKRITEKLKPSTFGKVTVPSVLLNFSLSEFIRKFWRLAVLEFKNVVRPVNFKIILSILALMFFLQNVMWNATYYLGPSQPLTSTMTFVRLPMGFFIMMLLMIWAGELFFKDRISNIWQITDSLPVPVWVTTLSKYVAISGVALITALVVILCGILAQILMGGWQEIDLFQYADDLLGYKWGCLTYLQNIALVFFLAGLTGNRFLTHILGVGYYFFNIISFDQGIIEELRFGYALTPGSEDFSDVNGYGIWAIASWWYFLLWSTLAIVFVILGIHFWKRGNALNFTRKLTFQTSQLNLAGKGLVVLCLVAFFFLQSFIVREVNDKGNFETETQEAIDNANYEKKYKWIENKPQPKLTGLNLSLDLFPEDRKASYHATMRISNPHLVTVDTLYLNYDDFVEFKEIKWNETKVKAAWKDDEFNQMALPIQMDASETGSLTLAASKQYVGFTQSGEAAQPDLTFNGLFMNSRHIIPNIGYCAERELDQNRDREEYGLEKIISRMASADDSVSLNEDFFAKYADWTGGEITLSTTADQRAIAPGKLIKSWKEENRNYSQFKLEHPSPYKWYFASGKYESHDFEADNVQVSLLYKPEHNYNLALYENAIEQSLSFINEKLGGYPFSEVRVIEIPFYQEDRYIYPNGIAISEKEGWYADTTGIAERAYMTFTVASQLIGQWIYQNVKIGNVQGADMLKIALPEALALQVVKLTYGDEAVAVILEKKQSFYNKERGNEPNQESPLIYADGAEYLEGSKGVIALNKLVETIRLESFILTLKNWINDQDDSYSYFKSLYEQMHSNLKSGDKELISRIFEEVI